MKVSVVIPNWNGEQLLEQNLPHVLKIGAEEIIVVDDGSTDGSVAVLKKLKVTLRQTQGENLPAGKAGLKVIENKTNLGFARAANRGVEASRGDIVVLLNTDVRPEPGLLDVVVPHFKDNKVFGVSFSEKQWSWGWGKWVNGFVEHEPGPRTNVAHPTFWVSGGSGAFRRSTWNELGGFDPVFTPFYWEDTDLSYRALRRGYKLLWEPKADVVHKHEGTIGRFFSSDYMNFIQERNQLIFIWKNITSPSMFREHMEGVIRRILRFPGYIKVVLAALSKISPVLKAREKEKKEAKVSDEQIFEQFE